MTLRSQFVRPRGPRRVAALLATAAAVGLAATYGAARADEPARPAAKRPAAVPAEAEEVAAPAADPWSSKPLAAVSLDIRPPAGELPESVAPFPQPPQAAPLVPVGPRPWSGSLVTWQASWLCHQPLYFQEVAAERYGAYCPYVQPLISGADFFARFPALPVMVLKHNPCECVYTLGYGRPGTPPPGR